MQRLPPTPAVVRYLDHELDLAAPELPAPPAAVVVPQGRQGMRRGRALVAALLAVLVLTVVAAAVSAQSLCTEPTAPACAAAEAPWCAPAESELEVSTIAPPAPRRSRETERARAVRPAPSPTMPWAVGMLAMVVVALLVGRGRPKSPPPPPPPNAAAASSLGTRAHQEDASAIFEVGPYSILVVADGMGGHPGGARASQLAVHTLGTAVCEYLRTSEPDPVGLERAVLDAFAAATTTLEQEELETGLARVTRDALRTTGLVVVADDVRYVAAGIGDGLIGVIRHGAGEVTRLFEADNKVAQHLVASSLGPRMHGEPVAASLSRSPGDLLIVATDGISDRVQTPFYDQLGIWQREGHSADDIAKQVIELATAMPEVFDDNATVAILLTEAI